ncbi:hypothetical protein P5V15_003945 [Pogonomyrmex californicus]
MLSINCTIIIINIIIELALSENPPIANSSLNISLGETPHLPGHEDDPLDQLANAPKSVASQDTGGYRRTQEDTGGHRRTPEDAEGVLPVTSTFDSGMQLSRASYSFPANPTGSPFPISLFLSSLAL